MFLQRKLNRCVNVTVLTLVIILILAGCGNEQKAITQATVHTEDKITVEKTQESTTVETTQDSTEAETIAQTTQEPELTEEETTDQKEQEASVKIIMAGDILLHEKVSDSGCMPDGTYNYNHLFENLKSEISQADLALVNQEVILGGTEIGLSGYPAFNGAYEVGDALVEAGFDVILHATNHALDKGKTGLMNCISFWKNKYPDMGVIGIQESQEEQDSIYVREVNGIKLAILNYTYGTNGIPLPSDMPYAVNLLDREKVSSDVAKAKELADFVIVCPHWGTEYIHGISSYQREWADYFAELGVNLVLGTHPHVIEPVEWIETENGKTLVYYSIGNFINSTNESGAGVGDRMLGALAEVTLHKNADGSVSIADYGVLPLVTHMKTGVGQITTYKLQDYTEALAMENEILYQDSGFSYQHCIDLCREVFGSLYED